MASDVLKSGDALKVWSGSALGSESTIHQLSPYIGKVKSTLAGHLVRSFSEPGGLVLDPFAGSGTVPMEAWIQGRLCWANDLSPYARTLTRGKLFPPHTAEDALGRMRLAAKAANKRKGAIDLRRVPHWVRAFYHPETLREILAWVQVLRARREYFLLSSLLGILHHQRPGFLSYPSSHTTPYLRLRSFPRLKFPELYEYRELEPRLEAKIRRAFRRAPELDHSIRRRVTAVSADRLSSEAKVGTVITSPPYMRLLDYGRDNRLRLWFLGLADWKALDAVISPPEAAFIRLMRRSFRCWHGLMKPDAYCVLVVGDSESKTFGCGLPDALARLASEELGLFSHVRTVIDPIPIERRARRAYSGNASESIVILKRRQV